MRFRPVGDHLKIKQFKQDELTAGGIVIPDAFTKLQSFGEITEVSDEIPKESLRNFTVGNVVLFPNIKFMQHEEEGTDYIFVPYHQIISVQHVNGTTKSKTAKAEG